MIKGYFITLEGGEGSGKSSQLDRIAECLRKLTSREIIASRSPGGTAVAEKIRSILKTPVPEEDLAPETELLLFAACHRQMTEKLIRPAIERGAIIISDRFTDSTLVYQGYARGIDKDVVRCLNTFSCGDVKPDLTIVLDVDLATSLKRTASRGNDIEQDRFDSESNAFHNAIREGFLDIASKEPERIVVIDATGTIDNVTEKIMEAVRARLAVF